MSTRIFLEPIVTLIGCSSFIKPQHIDWQPSNGFDGESLAEFGGRLCYMSFGKGEQDGHKTVSGRTDSGAYFENILITGHGSVLEHASWTFLFEGISRSLTHELVRHRHLSFSQLSQRYVDETNVGFVVPPVILKEGLASPIYNSWLADCMDAKQAYIRLTELLPKESVEKIKELRQMARSVLPNCTETKIVVTGNARAWRHFIMLRGGKAADTEIRRLTVMVALKLQEEAPNIFQDLEFAEDTVSLKYGSV